MKTILVLWVIVVAASSWASTNDFGTPPAPQAAELRLAELDGIINSIHADLLQLRAVHPWLAGYTNSCFWGHSIFFMPKRKDKAGGPGPQQPDQLYIGYGPIEVTTGFKYHNDVESVEACRFPSLGVKLYANILIRGKDNSQCADAVRGCIIQRCEALHSAMKK